MLNDTDKDRDRASGNDALGRRIRRVIDSSGMTAAEIAKACGVHESAPYGWMKTGRIKKPTLAKLAAVTRTNLSWMINGEGDALERPAAYRVVSVPLIEWADIGKAAVRPLREINLTRDDAISEKSFALTVRGAAMAAQFPEGSTIVVDPGRDPLPDSYVVAEVDGDHVLRQLALDGGTPVLIASNPAFPAIRQSDATRIVGTVVQAVINF